MEDKANLFIKLFNQILIWAKKTTGAFFLGILLISIFWYLFYTNVQQNDKDRIKDLSDELDKKDLEKSNSKNLHDKEIFYLRNIISEKNKEIKNKDNDCANQVILYNNLLSQIQQGTAYNKEKSKQLTTIQEKSLNEVKAIKNNVKSKIK